MTNSSIKLDILLETDHLIFINKPSGLMVHGDGRSKEKTLSDFLLEKYPDLENVGEPWRADDGEMIARPGIVHRLDKQTSGVMVVAKNQEMFESLKNQFQNRQVEKRYLCFVFGRPKEDRGLIDVSIGRSRKDFRQWTTSRGARGKIREAQTEYSFLGSTEDNGQKFSLVEAKPKTGRTHQIRVHFKHLGYPLVGDELYAGKQSKALGFDRLALHAASISVTDQNGQRLTVEAPLPSDFKSAISFIEGVDKKSLVW